MGAVTVRQHKRTSILVTTIALLLLVELFCCTPIAARFGGGHSFSSGSSSGYSGSSSYRSSSSYSSSSRSSRSSSGGGEGGAIMLAMLFYFPELLGVFFLVYYTSWARGRMERQCRNIMDTHRSTWDAMYTADRLETLRQQDPSFSLVLFLDFARLLFTRWQECRATEADSAEQLLPFLAQSAQKELEERRSRKRPQVWCQILAVDEIIVGSARLVALDFDDEWVTATVQIVSNYVEKRNEKGTIVDKALIAHDTIQLRRRVDVPSKKPEEMRALHCPACGAPAEVKNGCCAYCGAQPRPGEAQWSLSKPPDGNHRLPRTYFDDERPESRSAELPPLVVSPIVAAGRRDLQTRDPSFELGPFIATVKTTFLDLQRAWTSLEWEETLPLMTASLWEANCLWIERYRRTGRRNHLDDCAIIAVTPVAFRHDAFYDAITCAIDARGKDYTVDQQGRLVGGNRERLVTFREYWTFIRRLGRSAAEEVERHCPNCGSTVSDAKIQTCPSCDGLLESAEFDWTLAYVEQASVYGG